MSTKARTIERTPEDVARFHDDMQRIAQSKYDRYLACHDELVAACENALVTLMIAQKDLEEGGRYGESEEAKFLDDAIEPLRKALKKAKDR